MSKAFIIALSLVLTAPLLSSKVIRTRQDNGMSLEEFLSRIGKKERPVLVYFYADWCQPCKELKSVMDQLEVEEKHDVDIMRLDADENKALSDHYEINALPHFMIFKNGKNMWTYSGKLSKSELVAKINMYKASAPH